MILLDTCSFIWMVSDPARLSEIAQKEIHSQVGNLNISAVSALEIAWLQIKKKITLPMEASHWFMPVLEFHGIREIPVTSEIALLSAALPKIHRDPMDRIIIATAKLNKMKIVTPDKWMGRYPKVKTIW